MCTPRVPDVIVVSAPNLHPLVVHFPIALLAAALTVDIVDTFRGRPAWLGAAGTWLYGAGAALAVAAFLSGQRAAATVVVHEAVRTAITAHENWALATTGWFALVAVMRAAVGVVAPRRRTHRRLLVAAGVLGMGLLWQASDLGGRLVYRHGVGVDAAATTP